MQTFQIDTLERVAGIEPAYSAWKACKSINLSLPRSKAQSVRSERALPGVGVGGTFEQLKEK